VNTRKLIIGSVVAMALLSAALATLASGANADMYHRPYHHRVHRILHCEVHPASHHMENHDAEHAH
jgi:hypothetical protein